VSVPTFRSARRALHRGAWLSPSRLGRIAPSRPAVAQPAPKHRLCRCPWPVVANSAASRRRVRTSPPASSGIAPGLAASPALRLPRRSKLRLYVRNAGAKSAGCFLAESLPLGAAFSRPTLLGLSATTAPVSASHFPARIAPRLAACVLRFPVRDVASYVSTKPRLCRMFAPETLAFRGRCRPARLPKSLSNGSPSPLHARRSTR